MLGRTARKLIYTKKILILAPQKGAFFMRLFLFLVFTFSFFASFAQTASPGAPLRPPLELTSNFAEYRKTHFHSGIDLRVNNKPDKSVLSIWDGYVSRIRFNSASYGRAVYITHPNGYTSVYGHLDSYAQFIDTVVTNYQYKNHVFETDIELPEDYLPVKQGQIIGIAGNSGYSFGAHLHFEIRDTKTQDALNPLKFYEITDNIAPVFKQLIVYSMQKGGYLPAISQAYTVTKRGSYYSPATEVLVPDTFFLGFDVQDYVNSSYFRLLPKKIDVFIDDSLVWQIEFDRFAFDQTAACRGVFDHDAGLNKKMQIVTTYTGNANRQGFYKKYSNDGLITIPDNNIHVLTVKAGDTEFNTTEFRANLKRGNISRPNPNTKNQIHSGYFHDYQTENVVLKCDTGTFYGNLALEKPLIVEFFTNNHLAWTIGYTEIPLIKPMTMVFRNDSLISDKTIFAQMDKHRIINGWKPVKNSNGAYSVSINRPGTFELIDDTIPPTITKANIPANNNISYLKEFVFTVTDNSDEITRFNAYINGEWTLMIYDYKYNNFSIPLSVAQRKTIRTLDVEFIDLAGNITLKSFTF
ncbi:MAG: hypothetical protein CVU11_03955 [Bacteroidetes bacterium HGW-Bacteroidetes-6]|nr:MAG: hypothetical protein CVU11_03955 [Bacteroidetes bacterium HGW-Bacteroidetes-6]